MGNDCEYSLLGKLGKPRGSRNRKTIEREREKLLRQTGQLSAPSSEVTSGEPEGSPSTAFRIPLIACGTACGSTASDESCLETDTIDGLDWAALVDTSAESGPMDAEAFLDWPDGLIWDQYVETLNAQVSV